MTSQIEIFRSSDNQVELKVSFDEETVWLSQQQMADLFLQTKQNVSLHISNIFKEKELDAVSVVKESLTTASDGKNYKTKFYNLDVIISVGYRVKSQRGTQFRQWATRQLKNYLVQGYAINEDRLAQKQQEVQHLKTGIRILSRAVASKAEQEELKWLRYFAEGLQLLDDYDHEQLDKKGNSTQPAHYPSLVEYRQLVERMRGNFNSDVFGKEKDDSFPGSVSQISKGFGDVDFYPSLEEKAATLLYSIVKNHSFVDGNKRIAAACFLFFLEKNGLLLDEYNQSIVSNDGLASLTLLVAASQSEEMESIKQLIISVLNRSQRTER